MIIRARRSALYLPGSNPRALEKAKTLGADVLIFDLEDAVAPEAKDLARRQVAAAVRANGYGSRELVIRINALDTEWGSADLAAACAAGPDAVLVPKIEQVDDIADMAARLRQAGATERTRLWAMMETPLAVLNATAVAAAAAHAPLDALVIGTNDLAKALHARPGSNRMPLLTSLSLCVLAARAHGLVIFDGVYNDIADADGFARECRQGRDLGMDGKTLIHPSQIAPCNVAFTPEAAEIEQARAILAAFDRPENRGKGVLVVEGRMVERLHADMARRTMALAAAVADQS
jgi:citrate lyase subunit beta/citryl-CoA lyase